MFTFPSPLAQAREGIKRAFESGRAFEPYWSTQMNTRFLGWANQKSESVTQSKQTDYQGVWSNSKTARYRESHLGFFTHPDITRNWRIEVARFPVEDGKIGVIRAFEQFLTIDSVVVSQQWGNPNVGFGRWIFRLDNYTGVTPPQVNQLSPFPMLPGIVYSDFSNDTGLWYPAGSPSANNVRFLVPQKYQLRVFWESGVGYNEPPTVGAKLRGSLQSVYADSTIQNIRGSWQ
jgi:hypothetical protein